MTIKIDATPQEVAKLIFGLIDADVELNIVDADDNTEAHKAEILHAVGHALDKVFEQPTT